MEIEGNKFYKTGAFSEWCNTKTLKSNNNSAGHTIENFYTNNKSEIVLKKLINIKIIFNQHILMQTLEQKLIYENTKDNDNIATNIEIYNNETIENLIKKYCKLKKIKSNKLYITKKDFKKINKNLTINQAKIEKNETIYIFENENKNNIYDEDGEIIFNINFHEKNYSLSGFKNDKFSDCAKSFIDEIGEKNILFISNEKVIDTNKSLKDLNIKNGDNVAVGELK